jgi:thioredoxin 1
MLEVTDETFEREVLRVDLPVVVDFWAPWCGPCRTVTPVFEELARDYAGRLLFVKLNVDENLETPSRYGVLSLPTAIVFDGGEPSATVVGARRRAHYERAFAHWLV